MPLNNLFPQGSKTEQDLTENLIIESIKQYGKEFYYIPRTLVSPDAIFGEDPLSKFKDSYMIECYIDNVQEWGGSGGFMGKFGYMIEDQGQLTIARRRWEQMVGRYGQSLLPDRPTEGDLLYFPLAKSLFEIKYVEHQNPFYQLGKLYVYKVKIELFQYSSERIETDIDEINQIALDMTFDILGKDIKTPEPAKRDFFTNTEFQSEASSVLNFDERNPFGDDVYATTPVQAYHIDHLVIKYTNTRPYNMETRTRAMSSYFNGLFVGGNMETNVNDMVLWGGDAKSNGIESVYVDVAKIRDVFPDLLHVDIDCRAYWLAETVSGSKNVSITADSYYGGTPGLYDLVYQVDNAISSRSEINQITELTEATISKLSYGQRLATIRINLQNDTITLV